MEATTKEATMTFRVEPDLRADFSVSYTHLTLPTKLEV